MTQPWKPDRDLTIETATAVIRASLPSLSTDRLTFLGSGWEFDTYLTSDRWVVRFPRRDETATLFERERRIHELLVQYLPSNVALPRVECVGLPSAGFPYPVAAHRYIAGSPVDELTSSWLPSLARQIGHVLGTIHGIPEDAARQAGVLGLQTEDPTEEGRRIWVENGIDSLSRRGDLDPVVRKALAWVSRVSIPSGFDGPLALIHQDLSPEHVLADPATGRITGILDWTDAILGDAARDFVFLAGWRGWSFVEEVLRHYTAVDSGFRDRLRFMARLLTPIWLAYAYERGTEVEKMRAWVHNAYEESH
jgi:aminoglycoside phosphotransferase (APT) family kinase protein